MTCSKSGLLCRKVSRLALLEAVTPTFLVLVDLRSRPGHVQVRNAPPRSKDKDSAVSPRAKEKEQGWNRERHRTPKEEQKQGHAQIQEIPKKIASQEAAHRNPFEVQTAQFAFTTYLVLHVDSNTSWSCILQNVVHRLSLIEPFGMALQFFRTEHVVSLLPILAFKKICSDPECNCLK
ncbi:uncharacterized protein RHO25_008085 [Cercospora beticola]|uniref:Uncharacterized protein n=1 Tax=Cercospora beticola TaxID=122368 RepID=A0ABZ0NVE0_CERBT|nr:hypothetical protein RHO25_008085 [Cercospora beticola]